MNSCHTAGVFEGFVNVTRVGFSDFFYLLFFKWVVSEREASSHRQQELPRVIFV